MGFNEILKQWFGNKLILNYYSEAKGKKPITRWKLEKLERKIKEPNTNESKDIYY